MACRQGASVRSAQRVVRRHRGGGSRCLVRHGRRLRYRIGRQSSGQALPLVAPVQWPLAGRTGRQRQVSSGAGEQPRAMGGACSDAVGQVWWEVGRGMCCLAGAVPAGPRANLPMEGAVSVDAIRPLSAALRWVAFFEQNPVAAQKAACARAARASRRCQADMCCGS